MVIWKKNWMHLLWGITGFILMLFAGAVRCPAGEGNPLDLAVVVDDGELLTADEIEELKNEAADFIGHSGWNMIIATCDDAEGKSAQRVCEEYFNTYTAGDNGVSCLIDMDNREIYLATAGEAISYLTDSRIDDILDDAYEEVLDGEYAECFHRMIAGISNAWQKGIPDNAEIYNVDTGERMINRRLTVMECLAACVAAAAVFAGVFASIAGKYRLKWGTYHYDFHESGSMKLTRETDQFVNQIVTHHHINRNQGSGGGGGSQSTVHTGAGGRSFGGGGRKF